MLLSSGSIVNHVNICVWRQRKHFSLKEMTEKWVGHGPSVSPCSYTYVWPPPPRNVENMNKVTVYAQADAGGI